MNLVTGLNHYSVGSHQIHINFQCRYKPEAKEVIVFIHGLGCSLDAFRNVFDSDYFPDKSLMLVDLIGFGRSSKPVNFSYTMEAQARVIEQLLFMLPRMEIHIVAHSMGAAVALLFSPELFSRIKSFSNVEGNLISEDCGMLSRSIVSVPYDEYKDYVYKKHLSEFKYHQQLRFKQTDSLALYKSAASLVRWSDSGELLTKFRNLTCRKSYFYGDENKCMPVLDMLEMIPKYLISKSGHAMTTENPKEFYNKLADFINQNDAEF